MKFSAKIKNSKNLNIITVESNGEAKELKIASRPSGFGSSVNGGELLLLSLATCFCNERLIAHTDQVAEIHKTLRNGTTVTLTS